MTVHRSGAGGGGGGGGGMGEGHAHTIRLDGEWTDAMCTRFGTQDSVKAAQRCRCRTARDLWIIAVTLHGERCRRLRNGLGLAPTCQSQTANEEREKERSSLHLGRIVES